jgi:hypothetical protein
MKVGDFVRYTSTGDALGTGVVVELNPRNPHLGRGALVFWNGKTRGMPIRWIDFEYIEVINESR